MNWLILSVAALGIAALAFRRYKPPLELVRPEPEGSPPQPAFRKITALDRMIEDVRHKKDPLERHRLLGQIVDESYRQRSDAAVKKVFLHFAGMQVKELPEIASALKAAYGGTLPDVPAFKLLTAVLDEEGRHDEAVSVRKQAVEWGLIEGGKPKPAARSKKGEKKIKRAAPPAKRPARPRAPTRGKRRA